MTRTWIVPVMLLLTAGAVAQDNGDAPAAPEAEAPRESVLAARSLVHDADGLLLTPNAPARVDRLIVLSEFARRLAPQRYEVNRLGGYVYQAQEDHARAADALATCLKAAPADQAIWRQWLFEKAATLQTAGQRQAFFEKVVKDDATPDAVRAEAMVQFAVILVGQGRTRQAEQMFVEALKFDPYQPDALAGWQGVQTRPINAVDRCNMLLRQLRAGPLDVNIAWDLATLLGSMGLSSEALGMFDYARQIGLRELGEEAFPHAWLVQYGSAMLDAGRNEQAVKTLTPLLERFGDSVDLRTLLIEAHERLGQGQAARALIAQVEQGFAPSAPSVPVTPANQPGGAGRHVEQAMFYLLTKPDAKRALDHARQAWQAAGPAASGDPILQRLLGAAELANGNTGEGIKRLAAVADLDTYAAFFLARHHLKKDNTQSAAEAIGAGAALGRSGPAYRLLARVAKRAGLTIQAPAGAGQIAEHLRRFGRMTFQMGLHPERFIKVTLAGPESAVTAGEPVIVTARLTNLSPVTIPVGPAGLFAAAMSPRVAVAEDAQAVFTDLPMVVWHCPRYLKPGQTIEQSVRVDVGKLDDYLTTSPLSNVTLTVHGVFDPVECKGELRASLPSVSLAPATVVRQGLQQAVAEADDDAFAALKLALQADAAAEDPAARMKAARRVGSLLALIAEVDAGRARLPEDMPREMLRDDMLKLTRVLLSDGSAVVRAEMLTALRRATARDRLVLTGLIADDPSPLVRLQEAQLLGLSVPAGNVRLAELAKDEDPLVRRMASAFLEKPKPSPAGPAGGVE
ncbi:MAG: tetratricopeptide repeat protein [Planctomycetota bacterium]|jgi:tetratricopeptide (TPR) repeat protein